MKIHTFRIMFAALLVLTFMAWLNKITLGPLDQVYIRHVSTLLAVFGVVFLFMQFFLSARIKFFENGFGLDRMLNYHRFFGRIGLGLISLHFILIFLYQWLALGRVSLELTNLVGLIALVGLTITAGLASTYKKLGIAYEIWKNIHLINYILFPVALFHVFSNATGGSFLYYLWSALATAFSAIILYRLYQIYRIRNNPFEVVEVRQEADDIWSLFFKGKIPAYKPGQFLMVQLLNRGKSSSSHPFTISSSPTWKTISITPKELGDFTSTIKETRVGDKAFIDAPYGVFSYLNYNSDELVFIAGGIGITPFMSMLRYIGDQQPDIKVTLFWANKSEKNLCFQDELELMQEKIPSFTPVLVMSGQKDWSGEQGRVNGKLIQKYVSDLKGKDFFVCGPPPMSKAVRLELEKLKIPRDKIHFELFEL